MKNQITLLASVIIIALVITSLSSCQGQADRAEVLTTKIQYDVPVMNNDPQMDWWINNIEGSRREPFVQRIMSAAEKGEVKVYDYFNHPLTPAQIQANSSDTIYQTLLRTDPPYEEYDTMLVRTVSYEDIVKIRFLEEWKWDPKTLEIHKKVLAIGPVIQREIAGSSFNQLLYWIYFDKSMLVK